MTDESTNVAINPRPPSYLSLLNEEIIVKICEHLGLYEILQIGENDINYQHIIGQRIISKRVFDIQAISKHYDVRHAFKQFGGYATDLVISESSIQYKDNQYTFMQEIFRLINKRCTTGRLRSVFIDLDKRDAPILSNDDIIPDAFENIESLTVHHRYCPILHEEIRPGSKQFVKKLLQKCSQLRELRLCVREIDFLPSSKFQRLISLDFHSCIIPWRIWKQFMAFLI